MKGTPITLTCPTCGEASDVDPDEVPSHATVVAVNCTCKTEIHKDVPRCLEPFAAPTINSDTHVLGCCMKPEGHSGPHGT